MSRSDFGWSSLSILFFLGGGQYLEAIVGLGLDPPRGREPCLTKFINCGYE